MISIYDYCQNKKQEIKKIIDEKKLEVKLLIIQVNDDPASNAYIKGKINDLNECNMRYEHLKLSPKVTQEDLIKVIERFNKDDKITGILVQMPLPTHIDEEAIKRSITPSKDVDGFNPLSSFVACTPKGIVTFLEDIDYQFRGKNAVVLGRSNIVGKPMVMELIKRDMNVTCLHSKTLEEDRVRYIENADLIIVAIGKPLIITNLYHFKKSSYIFDVGINRVDGHLVGDCQSNLDCYFQSPVPKGVGLLTRLALLINLLEGAENGF